jgi:toxin FitB
LIIVDTNVISELMRERPDRRVFAWVDGQPSEQLFTTAITKAEILYGIETITHGKRRNSLAIAANAIFSETFKGRILAFDSDAAAYFAQLSATRKSAGRRMSEFDAQIAAIALAHHGTLATRNTRDFEGCGVDLIDPWKAR